MIENRSRGRRPLPFALLAVIGGMLLSSDGTGAALAQDGPNPSLTFSFGSTLEVNDNHDLDPISRGTTTTLDNRLGLSYLTETATASLRFDLSTVLRLADRPGRASERGFDDHRLGFGYTRQGANSKFSLSASERRSAVEFFDPFQLIEDPDAPVDAGDLTPGIRGDRADRRLGLSLETGMDGPLGFSLGLNRRERDFSQTVDPGYFDTVTDGLTLGARLQTGDLTSLNLTLSQTDYSAEDAPATERRTRSFKLGVSQALTPDLSLGVTLGKTDVDVDETIAGLRQRRQNDGLTANVTLSRALVNGTLGLTFARDVSINGTRESLILNRDLDLRDGALAFSLGATRLAGGQSTWVGTLAYRKDLPAGEITASLNRRATTSDNNAEVTTTRARIGWSHELTEQGGIDVSLDYLDSDSDAVGADRSRARMRLAYTWDLPQDWQLAGGYTRTESRRESGGDASSNAVFLSLQRAITFAP